MSGAAKKINNRAGHYVSLDGEGRIGLSADAILRATPCNMDPDYELVFAEKRTPSGDFASDKVTVMREIGMRYKTDGSVSTICGMDGCVIAYNERQLNRGMIKPSSKGRSFATEYGVTMVTVGIPEARYDELVAKAAEKKFRLVKERETVSGGYIWINASVSDVAKDGTVTSSSDDFFAKYEKQLFYFDTNSNSRVSIAPFSIFLSLAKRSVKGVFFGNMRLKDTVVKGTTKYAYTLGLTIHHLQTTDLVDASAPDLVAHASSNICAPWAVPSPELSELLQTLNSADAEDDGRESDSDDDGQGTDEDELGQMGDEDDEDNTDHA